MPIRSARASGLWQFIPGTGSRFGLKQDWWYDGRRDVVASTRAALDYLQACTTMFDGDWLLAIAAYNCGEGNVSTAIAQQPAAGKPIDFWNLKLPAETRGYVPRAAGHAPARGQPRATTAWNSAGMPDEPYFTQVETGGQINMEVAAELAGITKEEMYELNPALPSLGHRSDRAAFAAGAGRVAEASSSLLLPDARPAHARGALHVRAGDTVACDRAALRHHASICAN